MEERLAPVRPAGPGTRWIPAADLHLTLAFLGAMPIERLPAVEAAVAGVAAVTPTFEVGLSGAGSFGGHGRPRVAWLGIGLGRQAVVDLTLAVASALGMEPAAETRPHVTIARRVPLELVAAMEGRFRDGRPRWRADGLVLVRSHLGAPSSRYEVVGRWPLGRGPARQ